MLIGALNVTRKIKPFPRSRWVAFMDDNRKWYLRTGLLHVHAVLHVNRPFPEKAAEETAD
jgi:hypothetical protein